MKTRNELKVEHIIQTAQDEMKNLEIVQGEIVNVKGTTVKVKGEVVIFKKRTNSRERRPSISELDQRLRWVFKLMLQARLWLADLFSIAPATDHQFENPPSALNNFDYSSFLPRELRNLDQHQVNISPRSDPNFTRTSP